MSDATRTCPDEAALIGWLDEPGGGDPAIEAHVAACGTCAARVAALRAVIDGVAAPPGMPDAAALAAGRERILAAIGEAPAAVRVRRFPAWAWAPALAAAAVAAILLWNPAGEPPGEPLAPTVADAPAALAPVTAEAEAAAEAVVAEAAAPSPAGTAADEAGTLDEAAVESLAALEEAMPSLSDDDAYGSTLLADEFASLSDEDQAAILDELSDLTFDL